jgi:hypothetical protein
MAKYGKTQAALSKQQEKARVEELKLPFDYVQDLSMFPAYVRSKLHGYGLDEDDLRQYGIGWSKGMNRMIVPVYKDAKLIGWQGRWYGNLSEQPKYITRYSDNPSLYSYLPNAGSDKLIVVEDMLSGIKTAKEANTLVLLGNNMSDEALVQVLSNKEALIFLDHDNANVVRNQNNIRDRLTSVGIAASIWRMSYGKQRDPKEHTQEELRKIINGHS